MQYLLGLLQNSALYVAACVILLGVLIFVHELGHFLVARWCGVRVEVFSLGFGRKLWKKTVGDTTYCLSMIPLGGYVKMFGEQPGDHISAEDRAHSFTHKTVWQRIAIVLAGPLMNLFFAAIIFGAVAMVGREVRQPVLGDIVAGSKAAQAGFRSGDRVLAIDGKEVETFEDVASAMDENVNRSISFKVAHADRSESEITAEVLPRPNPNPLSLRSQVGDVEGLSTMSRAALVGVPKESPLYAVGLRSGDQIKSVDGKEILRYRDLETAFTAANGSKPLEIVAVRNAFEAGKEENLTVTLAADAAQGGFAGLRLESAELYLASVVKKSPAEAAGLQAGDRLVAVSGKPILKWEDVLENIRSFDGKGPVQIDFLRDGEAKSTQITPQVTTQITAYGTEDRRYTIGIVPTVALAMPDLMVVRTLNPIKALGEGIQQSYEFSVITVLSFVRLFQGSISPKTVGGLLSIGQAAGETMRLGLSKFLTMMAIISVNLFVLNLLPVPVLDGGHLVFYTIEAVKGSPLSIRKIEMAQQVGIFLLMGLMVFALFNDVTRIFFGQM